LIEKKNLSPLTPKKKKKYTTKKKDNPAVFKEKYLNKYALKKI